MKKHLVTVVKLLLVAALLWFAFRNVDFEDRLAFIEGSKVTAEEVVTIRGPWNVDHVAIVRNGQENAEEVQRGPLPDGRNLDVRPGFLTYWRNLDPWLFTLGAFCYFLTVLIAGARWWWLLRVNGTGVTLGETLRYTWIGVCFNTVMPGSVSGDLIKAIYIMKRCPGHRVPVLVSVIVDRVLGLASLALLGGIVVLFALDRFGEMAIAIWGVILGVGVVFLVAFSRRIRQLIRLNALLNSLPHKLSHLLRLVDQAVYFYRDHGGVILGSLATGIVNHVISVLSVMFIGQALGVGMPPLEYFALIPVINIISAVPLTPNGWGIGEAVYRHLFGQYGAPYVAHAANLTEAAATMGTRGVALSILYRIHLAGWSLLGGLFVLLEKDRVTRADIEREVQLEERDEDVEPPAGDR